jgi:hypothetical protein
MDFMPQLQPGDRLIGDPYLSRWQIEMILKTCKSHSGMSKLARHKTNANQAKGLVLSWVLVMVILAHQGAFAMAHLRELRCPETGESRQELEVINASLFKGIEKQIMTFGFYLEMIGCGTFAEHMSRMQTLLGNSQSNRINPQPKIPLPNPIACHPDQFSRCLGLHKWGYVDT